jgi:hypothetical protein
MINLQKLIVGVIEKFLELESTKNENDPNLFEVELYDIRTGGLILKSKAYIYKSKLKLMLKDLGFLLATHECKNNKITIKADDIPAVYKLKLHHNGNELIVNRCKFSSDFRLFFSESSLMEIEPVEIVFSLKEGEDLFCIKS